MSELANKVAVITGGGSGLGRELAIACARRGMKIMLADVSEPGLAETRALLHAQFPGIATASMKVDVAKLAQVEALAAATVSELGGAHYVFNNAGVAIGGLLWEHTEVDWEWALSVNLLGVAWGIKAFVPLLIAQGEGHVINTASAAGWLSSPCSGIYNAAKSAVVAMSETLALELQEAAPGVGVSVLSPAFFPTALMDSERNRPAELKSDTVPSEAKLKAEAQIRHAVAHGKLSSAEIAEITLEAVVKKQFYIFPHRKITALVEARARAASAQKAVFDSRLPL